MNLLKSRTSVLCLVIALMGCGSNDDVPHGPSDLDLKVGAEIAIKDKLRDPDSAKFSGARVSRKSGIAIVCGSVNSRNGFGGMTSAQRFISNGATLAFLEEEMADGAINELWARYC